MRIQTNTLSIRKNRRNLILLGMAAALVVAGIIAIVLINQPRGQSTPNAQTSSDSSPSISTPVASTTNSAGPATDTTEETDDTQIDASVTPIAPSGVFVSNHRPNLGGNPAPNSETSTCSTTPGATCTIRFVMGGVTKSLPPQITGAEGNTSWTWTLQEVGLTAGEWRVSAIATNGDKTSVSDDALRLVVAE